jgi:GR25 family glycosyltransferase involved in LPS biosynthesis
MSAEIHGQNPEIKVKCFIIHLASAVGRQPIVERLQRETAFEPVIIEAVDKAALTDADIKAVYVRELLAPRYPFDLGKGEIACFLSHRSVWRRIAEGSGDFALVLEDDVELESPVFAAQLEWALSAATADDLVRFPRRARTDQGAALAKNDAASLILPVPPGLQTCAALVGRRAAGRLLAQTGTFDRPIDAFLQMNWVHGVRICALQPPCIVEVGRGDGKSLAQSGKKSAMEKLRREFVRWRYRSAIRRKARQTASPS